MEEYITMSHYNSPIYSFYDIKKKTALHQDSACFMSMLYSVTWNLWFGIKLS